MTDNRMYEFIKSVIDAQALAYWGDVTIAPEVKRSGQQRISGLNSMGTIYIDKLFDRMIGSPKRSAVKLPNGTLSVPTIQLYETTLQIETLVDEGMETTGSDLANWCASIFKLDDTISKFVANQAGVLAVSDVRNVPFRNDRDEQQKAPSFDLIVRHRRTVKMAVPAITGFKSGIHRV